MRKVKVRNGGTFHVLEKGETANPNGAPKRSYSKHIADIKAMGYTAPIRSEYFDMVGLLLSMTETDLKEFAEDENRPYWIRLIIKDLNNKFARPKLMADYRDWIFGKAEQHIDHTTKGEAMQQPAQLSQEQIDKLIDRL